MADRVALRARDELYALTTRPIVAGTWQHNKPKKEYPMNDEMAYTDNSELARARKSFDQLREPMNALRQEKVQLVAQKTEAEALIAALTPTSPEEAFVAAAAARERIKVVEVALVNVDRRMAVISPEFRGEQQGFESARAHWQSTRAALLDPRTSSADRERYLQAWRRLTGMEWDQE